MSPPPDLDSADPPDYPNWEKHRERFKQSVKDPQGIWVKAYEKMADVDELKDASEEEIVAATMRTIVKALP
jgi:hypothetical protein